MRKIIVATTLAMIMSMALISLTRGIEGRASASNANSLLLAQGRVSVSINDASLTEGDAGTSNMVFMVTGTILPQRIIKKNSTSRKDFKLVSAYSPLRSNPKRLEESDVRRELPGQSVTFQVRRPGTSHWHLAPGTWHLNSIL